LLAPIGVSATSAARPLIRWANTTTGATSNQIKRWIMNWSAGTGSYTPAATSTVLSVAPALASYTEAVGAVDASTLYGYTVQPMWRDISGPPSSPMAYALPGLTRPTLAAITGTGRNGVAAGTIRLTWGSVYLGSGVDSVLQRCFGTLTACTIAGATWSDLRLVSSASGSYSDSGLTRGSSYSYRIRSATANQPGTNTPYVSVLSGMLSGRAN
jgi:hypothetical protein